MLNWRDLWPQERAIALAVKAGVLADGAAGSEFQHGSSARLKPTCRGEFIAKLLRGEVEGDRDGECIVPSDPGASISGYRIEGPINLIDQRHAQHQQELKPLLLENCEITEPIQLAHAHIARMSIINCRWRGMDAAGCKIKSSFDFTGSVPMAAPGDVDGFANTTINLLGARIEGPIHGNGALLYLPPTGSEPANGNEYYALNLMECEIHGSVNLTTSTMVISPSSSSNPDARFVALGSICLDSATVTGDIWLSGALVMARFGDALRLQNARVRGALVLDGLPNMPFQAFGRVWLLGAHIEGGLQAIGGQLVCAKDATNFVEDRGIPKQYVDYWHASHPDKSTDAHFHALVASNSSLGHLVHFREGFEARGLLDFRTARIAGDFDFSEAKICGSALFDAAVIDGYFHWEGLTIDGADMRESADQAIMEQAKSARFWQRLVRPRRATRERAIREEYYSRDDPPLHTLSLREARIGSRLYAANLVAPDGAMVDLRGCRLPALDDDLGTGWGRSSFEFGKGERHKAVILRLDGFDYSRLESSARYGPNSFQQKTIRQRQEETHKSRIDWLNRQYAMGLLPNRWNRHSRYRPWAYLHLAKVLRNSGEGERADAVERQSLRFKRNSQDSMLVWPFSWAFDLMFGSGYLPVRTLGTLATSLALGFLSVLIMQADHMLVLNTIAVTTAAQEMPSPTEGPVAVMPVIGLKTYRTEIPCGNAIDPFLYAADAFIPVVQLRQEERCEITSRPGFEPGVWRILKGLYAFWGWIAVSLSILTFSGIVRARRSDIESRG